MKRYTLLLFLFLTACYEKDSIVEIEIDEIPQALQIADVVGIKLESTIVTDNVAMNVKLPETGVYRIKIRDFTNELVSQEKVNAKEGDNILKVYVKALEKDSYTIELANENHTVLARDVYVIN